MLSGGAAVYLNTQKIDEEGNTLEEKIKVGTIQPGAGFGELALINSKPRAATVNCVEESEFAVLEKEDYMRILKKFDERKLNSTIDFFKALPLFCQWTRQSVGKLTFYFKVLDFTRNSFVYRENDSPNFVYFVKKGEFNLIKNLPTESQEQLGRKAKKLRVHVAILGVGEMFGNDEVLKESRRQHSCQCASSIGSVYCIEREDFMRKIAFARNLQTVAEQGDLRQEEHLKRLNEIELINRATKPLTRPKQRRHTQHSSNSPPIAESRSASRVAYAPLNYSPDPIANISMDAKRSKSPVRTMTNLARLPAIPDRFNKPKVSLQKSPRRTSVRNIHMQALRDKHMYYYERKPYMLFARQRTHEVEVQLLSVSRLENPEISMSPSM